MRYADVRIRDYPLDKSPQMVWSRTLRRLVGLLMLAAATLKFQHFSTTPIVSSDLVSSPWLRVALVEGELALGLWLISGICPRWSLRVAFMCFCTFASVAAYYAVNGAASCGCFGSVSISPWLTLSCDLTIAALLLLCRPTDGGGERNKVRRTLGIRQDDLRPKVAIWAAIFLFIGLPAGRTIATFQPAELSDAGDVSTSSGIAFLRPQEWIGKAFPLLTHIIIGEDLATGEWTVLLYHSDCSKCRTLLGSYEQDSVEIAPEGHECRVALIEVPPYGEPFAIDREVAITGRLSDHVEWFVETPCKILIQDGRVVSVRVTQL